MCFVLYTFFSVFFVIVFVSNNRYNRAVFFVRSGFWVVFMVVINILMFFNLWENRKFLFWLKIEEIGSWFFKIVKE